MLHDPIFITIMICCGQLASPQGAQALLAPEPHITGGLFFPQTGILIRSDRHEAGRVPGDVRGGRPRQDQG